jgi:DNA helicase II / ATP-dependent DNA helicase PcrA
VQQESQARRSQGQRRLQQAHEQQAAVDRLRAAGTAPPATVRQYELAAARRRQEGEALMREAEAALATTLTPPQREAARRAAPAAIRRLVDAHWPAIDPLRDYAALLADAPLLERLGAGLFSAEEVAALRASLPPTDAAVLDRADLPALHYLFVLSQGADAVGRAQHAYVVVDEAQDVSPLDLLCLRHLEQRPCFTLLGDLAQSIYAHRGLTSWDEAAEVFAGGPYRFAECRVGYRTTAEITALANRVRRGTADGQPSGAPALAFDRHGPPPVLTAVAGEAELPLAVVGAVSELRGQGHASVGIITRTPARALALAPLLARAGLPDAQLALAPDFAYRGGVIVLPVALAKGLEFDAAVVVDADGATYGPSAFDARLLYVALTRALHALRVIWAGSLSPHLAGPAPTAPDARGSASPAPAPARPAPRRPLPAGP